MLLYKQLRRKLNYLPDESQIEQIYQAYLFAADAHTGQKRQNGDDFITHPIAVAMILADMHMDYHSIIAALLHDSVEDTAVTKDMIIQKFTLGVADLVDGVTKLTQIEATNKVEAQAESFRKMVLAMARDIRVILIKLADRIHNMQTIFALSAVKSKRIARETLDIYAPIANRLGMHSMYIELENLAFATLYPRRHRVLKTAVEKARGNRQGIVKALEKDLQHAIAKTSLQNVDIFGREKHLYGIYKKMQNRSMAFSDILDVYAFRILVDNSIDDCYRALGIVHGLYKPIPGRFKDYITIPKGNGYQSLHTTLVGPYGVPIEIQIRTPSMEQMAENGIAAHWLYKISDRMIDAAHIRAQQWVNKLLEMQRSTGSSVEFLENVKVDLFPEEVYVFTPKGNILELPRGSTAVDFAYAVHTDIGNTCVAVRVDHRFLPLSSTLFNGQTISVVTDSSAKPSPMWLNFVVTAKARSEIRNFLKNQKHSESVSLGKMLLQDVLSRMTLDITQLSPQIIDSLLQWAKVPCLDDLYEEIGLGNRLAVFVANQISNIIKHGQTANTKLNKLETKPLLIRGADGMAIDFSLCCCPIPGDQIVGYLNAGHGLDIHIKDCSVLVGLRNEVEKCVSVKWADDTKDDFNVLVHVEMINNRGALAALVKSIAEANSNINDISMLQRSERHCLVVLKLAVKNLAHLERVFRHVSNIPVVIGIVRKKDSVE